MENQELNNDQLANALIEKEQKINELFATVRQLDSAKDEALRKAIKWDRWYTEVFNRHKSKLMTAYYLLDQLANVGTHHEKEVVIRYIRSLLEGFMKDDKLPFDKALLPF